jgi:tetratricopeptide (TPR) repeat protein
MLTGISRWRSAVLGIGLLSLDCAVVTEANAGPTAGHAAEVRSASQLLQSTAVDRILRADVEKTTAALDKLPDEIPVELRAQLRTAVGKHLDYSRMQAEVAGQAAARLSATQISQGLSWWQGGSGVLIAAAELSAYRTLTHDSPAPLPPRVPYGKPDPESVRQVVEASGYPDFARELQEKVATARQCLLNAVVLMPDCDRPDLTPGPQGPPQARVEDTDAIQSAYASVPPGDLAAYLQYLRTSDTRTLLARLRESLLEVEQRHTVDALNEVKTTIHTFVSRRAGDSHKALADLTSAVDTGRDLEQVRLGLKLLRYADERNPDIPLQLTRVAIILGVSDGYVFNPGYPPPVDKQGLAQAQRWIKQAHALDPERADTLVMEGYVAYVSGDYERGVQLLEHAAAIGTANPWLHVNLGDVLWLRAAVKRNKEEGRRAAAQYEAALSGELPEGARGRALQQLAALYDWLGDLPNADRVHRQNVAFCRGECKGYALSNYATFLLYSAHDVDAAVRVARSGLEIADYQVARELLAESLMVKSGMLFGAGDVARAYKLIAEARQVLPDIGLGDCESARLRVTFPAVRAAHDAGVLKDFSGVEGGRCLVRAAEWGGSAEISQLLAWGANPNYLDDEGTPLQRAMISNNVAAAKALLAHGADPMMRFTDGRLPVDVANDSLYERHAEMLELLKSTTRSRGGAATLIVAKPFKQGYTYRVKQPIGDGHWGHEFKAGELLIYASECGYTDSNIACFMFARPAQPGAPLDIAISKDKLPQWDQLLEEVGRAPH